MRFEEAFDPVRSLRASWAALSAAPAPLWVGGILMFLTDSGGGGGPWGMQGKGSGRELEELWPLIVAGAAVSCCMGIAFFVLSSWVWIGFANSVEEVMRTGRGDVGRVFESKGRVVTMMLARVLSGLLTVLALVPLVIAVGAAVWLDQSHMLPRVPAIGMGITGGVVGLFVVAYVALGLTFVPQSVALEGADAVDAVRRSWSLAQGHRWRLFFFHLVTGVFLLLGFCLCCVGVFATGTLATIARVESYVAFTRGSELPGWWATTGQSPATPTESWGAAPPVPPPLPG